MRTAVRVVDLGLPPEATHHDGTTLVGDPVHRRFVFTFAVKPKTVRLACFHLADGRLEIAKGIRGELVDGLVDAATGHVHALTDQRLCEVAFEPLRVVRETTPAITKYALRLFEVPGTPFLAVRWNTRTTAQLVHRDLYTLGPRVSLDQADAALTHRGRPTLVSFWKETGRPLDAAGRAGRAVPVPGARCWALRDGELFGVAVGDAQVEDDDPAGWDLVRHDTETLSVQARRRGYGDVSDLVGFDAAGRMIARTASEVLVIDPASLTAIARIDAGRALFRSCLAGPCTLVAATAQRSSRDVVVVSWDRDAR